MSAENTGYDLTADAIERLQAINKYGKRYAQPTERARYYEVAIDGIPTACILGHYLLVTCEMAFAPKPEEDQTYISFDEGVQFIGLAGRLAYRQVPALNLNGLTMDFTRPDIFTVGGDELDRFRNLELLVPVAGISSCLKADSLMSGMPPGM